MTESAETPKGWPSKKIFKVVSQHLLRQNAKSLLPEKMRASGKTFTTTCAYRGEEGRKCAVGCLIPDNKYTEDLEGLGVLSPNVWSILEGEGIVGPQEGNGRSTKLTRQEEFLSSLQGVHDSFPPEAWPERLEFVRKHYGISVEGE
jgi:hypothetical protein